MFNLKDQLMLSQQGDKNLKKAIMACTLTNLSLMLPFGITIQIFAELLKPFTGGEISWRQMWLYFAMGVCAAVLVFLALKNDYKKTYVASYLESENARIQVAEHLRRLPMSVFNSKDLTELTTNIMGDCATTEHVLSHIIPQLIANCISMVVICTSLALFEWRLALSVFISVPAGFAIILLSRSIQRKLSKRHVEAKLNASGQVQEYIEGLKVIKACGLDGEKFKSLEEALRHMMRMAIQLEFISGVFVTGAQIIIQAGIGLTVFVGTYLLTGSQVTLVPLLMFMLIVVKIYGPFLTILTLLPELLYMQTSTEKMRTLFSVPVMTGLVDVKLPTHDIEMHQVSFAYQQAAHSGSAYLFENLSLKIPANGITALVGPSGSGKSTLTRLIARFWDVSKGTITIGGVNVQQIDPEELMAHMAFVFQEVVLFNDTVLNNIKIGKMDATREEVIAAAKAACCDSFINRLPQGYDTVLGENGGTLSGGERQRLSIARALLKDAPIILLDEATASLDPENEVSIQQAITQLIQNKTVIVIAHRLRTIENADKIVVLDQGRIVEEGTHEVLLKNKGLYAHLYDIQQESMGWQVQAVY